MKKILCIGATGRMGGAVAESLIVHSDDVEVIVAGRNTVKGEEMARALGPRGSFRKVDIDNPKLLETAIKGVDLVFNSAGPFQTGHPVVFDAALKAGIDYLDIADDIDYARTAKTHHKEAQKKDVSAIVSGGLFPGYSNIMAGEMIERGGGAKKVEFLYFMAGTGGAGPAVMSSTFLLTGVPAIEYVDGLPVEHQAFTGRQKVQFMEPLGERATFYLELPEAHSCFETYNVPNVLVKFGTAPEASNIATYLTGKLAPQSILRDTARVANYVKTCAPFLELMDKFVGSHMGLRVNVDGNDGIKRCMQFYNPCTIKASGVIIAHQVLEVANKKVKPGVWWPEEAVIDKMTYLKNGAIGSRLEIHDPTEARANAPAAKKTGDIAGPLASVD